MNLDQRKAILVVAALVMMGALFAWWHFSERGRKEPVYQGWTLTQWLEQLDDGEALGISSGRLPSPTPGQLEAARAIRAMGPEALPLLMEDIHARRDTNCFRIRFYNWAEAHLSRSLSSRLFSVDPVTEDDRIRWRAAQGLAALGPLAKPARPELKRLLFTNYWHSSIKEAAYALSTIGPEGVEVLTNAVQPQTEWSGMCAIWALGQHPEVGTNDIPFFIKAAKSSSEGTAEGAIEVLGLFHTDPGQVIPALTNILTGKNAQLSQRAARSLAQFGPQAAAAAPLLEGMTNNPAMRGEALRALKQIR